MTNANIKEVVMDDRNINVGTVRAADCSATRERAVSRVQSFEPRERLGRRVTRADAGLVGVARCERAAIRDRGPNRPGPFGDSGEPRLGVRLTLCRARGCSVTDRSCGHGSGASLDSRPSGSSGRDGGQESRARRRSRHARRIARYGLIATFQLRHQRACSSRWAGATPGDGRDRCQELRSPILPSISVDHVLGLPVTRQVASSTAVVASEKAAAVTSRRTTLGPFRGDEWSGMTSTSSA